MSQLHRFATVRVLSAAFILIALACSGCIAADGPNSFSDPLAPTNDRAGTPWLYSDGVGELKVEFRDADPQTGTWEAQYQLDDSIVSAKFDSEGALTSMAGCSEFRRATSCNQPDVHKMVEFSPLSLPVLGSALLVQGEESADGATWDIPGRGLSWTILEKRGPVILLAPNSSTEATFSVPGPCHALLNEVQFDTSIGIVRSCEAESLWVIEERGWMPEFRALSDHPNDLKNRLPAKEGVLFTTLRDAVLFAQESNSEVNQFMTRDWYVVSATYRFATGTLVGTGPCEPSCIQHYKWRVLLQNQDLERIEFSVNRQVVWSPAGPTLPPDSLSIDYVTTLDPDPEWAWQAVHQPMSFEASYEALEAIAVERGYGIQDPPFVQFQLIPSPLAGGDSVSYVTIRLKDVHDPSAGFLVFDLTAERNLYEIKPAPTT